MKSIRSAILVLIVGVVLMLPQFVVFAGSNPIISITVNANELAILQSLEQQINEAVCNKVSTISAFMTIEEGDSEGNLKIINITLDMMSYGRLESQEKQDVMKIALDYVRTSNLSTQTRNKVYNFISESDEVTSAIVRQLSDDVRADFVTAYRGLDKLHVFSFIRLILGLFVLSIFILLTIGSCLDIAYISIPMFQMFINNMNDNASGDGKKKVKLRWVSAEAVKSVESAYEAGGKEYKNPLILYLGRRYKQFIAIAICLLYLTSGKIFILMSSAVDYFSGLVG